MQPTPSAERQQVHLLGVTPGGRQLHRLGTFVPRDELVNGRHSYANSGSESKLLPQRRRMVTSRS